MYIHHKNYRLTLFSLLLIAGFLLTACRDSQNEDDEQTNRESSENSSVETAVIKNTPFNEGINQLLAGDPDAALTIFEIMVDDRDDDETLYGEVGIAAVNIVNNDDATSTKDLRHLLRKLEGDDLLLGQALAHDALGTLYLQQGDFADASESLLTAITLSAAANNVLWQASLTQKAGRAYAMQQINGLAYDYTLQAYNLYTQQDNPENQARSLIQLGQIFTQLGLLENALTSYQDAEDVASANDNTQLLVDVLIGQGDIKAAQGEVEQAKAHYTEALALVQGKESTAEATSLLKLGQMQAQTGEIETASASYAAAKAIFTSKGDTNMVATVEEALAYLPTGKVNVNLVQNPGNEEALINNAIPKWTVEAGLTNWRRGQEVTAAEGEAHFFVGAATEEIAELCQQIDITNYALYIDSETQTFELALYTQVYPPSIFSSADSSQYLLEYYGESEDDLLDLFSSPEYQPFGRWEEITQTITPPIGTRAIRLCLRSIKYGGFDSDGYFDDISLIALPPK